MWRPLTYADVDVALGVAEEGHQLDFKREMSNKDKKDLAKDAAAMSIDGGVILIGVAENDQAVADSIEPVELKGIPEQVRQIVDSGVRPALAFEIDTLRAKPTEEVGIVVLTIPPSLMAPHMSANRYPARSSSTTRYLDESEVAALYERRRVALAETSRAAGMGDFVAPEGASNIGRVGIGRLRVHIRPLVRVQHPAFPRLQRPLGEAVQSAAQDVGRFVDPHLAPAVLDFFAEGWAPRGTVGFKIGVASDDFEALRIDKLSAATFSYEQGFSFQFTMAIDQGDHRVANERLWAAELLTMLSIAARFYRDIPGASLLRVDLMLDGLENAVSWHSSRGRAFAPDAPRITDNSYVAGGVYGSRQLVEAPDDATRSLLDRFFVSFLPATHDVVGSLKATEAA